MPLACVSSSHPAWLIKLPTYTCNLGHTKAPTQPTMRRAKKRRKDSALRWCMNQTPPKTVRCMNPAHWSWTPPESWRLKWKTCTCSKLRSMESVKHVRMAVFVPSPISVSSIFQSVLLILGMRAHDASGLTMRWFVSFLANRQSSFYPLAAPPPWTLWTWIVTRTLSRFYVASPWAVLFRHQPSQWTYRCYLPTEKQQ